MSAGQPKVLVLDGMWNKSLAAVRSLGKRGFHVTAGERTYLAATLFSRYCSRRIIYPSPSDRPEEFLECLERELATGDYDVVIPMEWNTQVLLTDPANRHRLERYTKIPFVDADLAGYVNDKAQLMRFAKTQGIEIPETYFVEGMEELKEIAENLDYPAVIKPRISSGSRGLVYVRNKRELLQLYPVIHERYPFPIIQDCLQVEGDCFGVGVLLNSRSQPRASFVYRRIRSYPVSGGPSTLRESVKTDDIRDIAVSLFESLKWSGVAHAEFKIDPRDGKPKLLEINPRFWGSLALAIEAGVDFPFLLYKLAMDGDVEPVMDYQAGVQCRWLIPGDMLHFIKNPERFRLNPGFFDFRIKDDIISRQDPLPALGRVLSVFTLLLDKEMRGLIKR